MNDVLTDPHSESYLRGVRRRVRSAAILLAIFVVISLIFYVTYAATHSTELMLAEGILLGVLSEHLDMRIDPIKGLSSLSRSDRTKWLVLFVPFIVGSAAYLIYFAGPPHDGLAIFGASLFAVLLGFVVSATFRIVRPVREIS